MKQPSERLLLPHEVIFGGFLLITWLRFGLKLGFTASEAMLYLGLMGLDAGLISYCRRRPTRTRWVLRLLFHPTAMPILFAHMKAAIPRIAPQKLDLALQHLDRLLVGGDLSVRMQGLIHPALTEILSICYQMFIPYLVFSLVWYFRRDLDTLKSFLVGLFSIYGIGFLGYSLVPAWGPWIALKEVYHTPLTGGWFTPLNDRIVRLGTNGVDVFPSLHCALTSFLLFFDRRHARWRFLVFLAPCAGLWLSTLYLRYHYFTDVLCGFMLSALGLWLSARFEAGERSGDEAKGRKAAPAAR